MKPTARQFTSTSVSASERVRTGHPIFSLTNLSVELGKLSRQEDASAAIEEATGT